MLFSLLSLPPHTQREVLANCQALNKALQAKGYNIVSGGTDNHLILVNVRDKGLDGSKVHCPCHACATRRVQSNN